MDIMFDIETLGTKAGYMVLNIGYVAFDKGVKSSFEDLLNNGEIIYLSISDQQDLGLKINIGTLQWWMKQSEEARNNSFNHGQEEVSLKDALRKFAGKCSVADEVWTFGYMDISMVNWLMDEAGTGDIFYRRHSDMRTIAKHWGQDWPTKPNGFIAHDPMHDAAYQAYVLQRIFND